MDNSSKPLRYSEYQKLIRKSVIENRLGKGFIRDLGISLGIGLFNGLIIYYFTKGVSDILSPLVLIITTFLVYAIIYLIYFHREKVNIYNEQKKRIYDFSPAKPDIDFVFSEFSQTKGKQKIIVINNSPKEISCHAVFTYIAPMVLNKFSPFPAWWYSKNLVWSNKNSLDGNIVIDRNGGRAILDIAETSDERFNFLFQNGEAVQVGFDWEDEYKKDYGLPENAYLVNLRLDGKFEGKDFIEEKRYFLLFKIQKIDEEKNITIPFFQLQEVFENSGGV